MIVVGRFGGPHGVRGGVWVFSETRPKENILDYPHLFRKQGTEWIPLKAESTQLQAKGIIFKVVGIDDRTAAEQLKGREIAVERAAMPDLAEGDFYWADLVGLQVETTTGVVLGRVDHLIETGANDVLVVEGERQRLIPFVLEQFVLRVDQVEKKVVVDWDPDF